MSGFGCQVSGGRIGRIHIADNCYLIYLISDTKYLKPEAHYLIFLTPDTTYLTPDTTYLTPDT